MAHRSLFAHALLVAFGVITSGALADEPPPYPVGENGCAGGRVLEHLERHGDFGQMDAEAQLYVSRLEHESRMLAKRQGLSSEAIAGEVWTSLGPTNGAGRAIALAFHPTNPAITIMGAAGGGAWRTTNEGVSWTPLTETIPNLSVGAIAFAPTDPNRVYLGTGEGGYASDFIPGIGLLTSNDGGDTWTLPETALASMFYRINVHPTNANELIVGTNKGALRSTNGPNGPWSTVINGTPSVTAGYGDVTDIVRDPSNPAVLYAATWDRMRWCAKNQCNSANNFLSPTILKSTNSGATWTPTATGFPTSNTTIRVERISLAIAPSSPNTLYALTSLYDGDTGVTRSHVYKTTNGGASWSNTGLGASDDPRVFNLLGTQGWYDTTIVVSPTDPNVVIAGGVYYARTMNGGTTWSFPFTGVAPHVDVHDLRYHPVTRTLWIANDGGIWTSNDNATTATSRNVGLVTRQYYAMAMDLVNRNRILAGTQDNGTNARPDSGGTAWSLFSGGDGFQCIINTDAPGVAYSTYQFAEVLRTKNAGGSSPLTVPSGPVFDADEKKPFFSILKRDPVQSSMLYLASTRVWKSSTGGDAWVPLSTNITAGAPTWTDESIRSIAIAPSHTGTIMIAKGARIFRTTDGGANWIVLTNGLPGRNITNIEISPVNRDVAYATIAGTSGPSVYFTTDGGFTWNARANGLPSFSAHVIRFDPTDPSTLYVGTDVGVYRSSDSGGLWTRFGSGMPAVSVYDLQIHPDGAMFRAATHGRGIWQLTIPDATNAPPVVSVTAPSPALTIARGQTITFTGEAADPDNEPVTLKWTFPDDWSSSAAVNSATHRFDRAGTWPVSLVATDPKGAMGGAQVMVTVTEPGDDCESPFVVPGFGPFPYSMTLNAEVATAQIGVEPNTGGSCYPFRPLRTFWLSFTPIESGTYVFSLCTSRIAAFMSAYTGPACGDHQPLPMCLTNTNLSGNCGNDPTSSMELVAGTQYRFFVGSYYSNSFGPITVTISRGTSVPAAVRSVAPASGAAGTPVIVTGSGFAAGASVSFGGVAATNVTVISPTLISAVAPSHVAGNVDVAVRVGDVTATSANAFTYAPQPAATQPKRRPTRK